MKPRARTDIKSRVLDAGKLMLIAGALCLTFIVFFAAAMRVAVKSREVSVPDVMGLTVNDAAERLGSVGLRLAPDQDRRLDPEIPADHVVAQDPPAGASARRPRTVRVWLSAGDRVTVVPPLVGESETTAQLRLQADMLELTSVAEVRSNDYPPGVVVAQIPSARSNGTQVALLVNRGERSRSYVMPDLIGTDGGGATDLLRAQGFRVAVVGEHPYPGVPRGIVLRQYPAAGFQIGPGEAISIEVSQ